MRRGPALWLGIDIDTRSRRRDAAGAAIVDHGGALTLAGGMC
jgi:hypothetical protein